MNRVSRAWSAALLVSAAVRAGGPTAWESNTFSDFIKGRFQGISLTRDGRLTVAPSLETLASTGEAGVWSVVSLADGTLYFASGHRGRVYQLKPGGQPAVIWASAQPEVFALVADAKGVLYAGTSPDGKEGIVGGILHLFADEDGESSAGYINSVAIYDDLLSADAVSALGGPTAGGISAVPEPATLTLVACAVFVWVQFGGRRNGGRQ